MHFRDGWRDTRRWRTTFDAVSMWLRSAPTPGVPTTSYRLSSPTSGFIFMSSASG